MKKLFDKQLYKLLFKPVFAVVSLVMLVLFFEAPGTAGLFIFFLLYLTGFSLAIIEFILACMGGKEE